MEPTENTQNRLTYCEFLKSGKGYSNCMNSATVHMHDGHGNQKWSCGTHARQQAQRAARGFSAWEEIE